VRGRVAWAHDYDTDRSIGTTFVLCRQWRGPAADAALATASAEMKWMNGWSAAGTFEGEFSNVTNSYAGKGLVRYQW
jgi:uncharacterized protein with beta-barrel porin domain